MLHDMQEACPDAAWAGTVDSAVGTFFKGRTSGQATSVHAARSVQEGKNRQITEKKYSPDASSPPIGPGRAAIVG